MRSSFAMTEPAPGGGSDPSMIKTYAEKNGDTWKIYGRKWFITGAAAASHFILAARTSDDKRKGITTFLYHKDQPGWRIVRRIEIMGPEEHGGHCELEFDGLEVHDDDVFGGVGDGLKVVQVRLGPARLTHCMRWLGWSKRCMEIAQEYVNRREGFGVKLADRESVQMKLGEVGHNIQIGRLLTMHAAWKLDQGDFARKEVSMAKVHMANTLHQAADVAIQLQGARGYSKDTVARMGLSRRPRRPPRRRRRRGAQDGAGEIHARGRPRFLELERGQQRLRQIALTCRGSSAPRSLGLCRRACCFGGVVAAVAIDQMLGPDDAGPDQPVRIELEPAFAERVDRDALQHEAAEALLPRRRDRRPAALAPGQAKILLARSRRLARPVDVDLAGRHRQRAVFRGVGGELVQRQRDVLHRFGAAA